MRKLVVALLMVVAGCGNNELTLHYQLDNIAPTDVIRVETRVDIADSDARNFYVDQPFRSVATGVGYEVRDVDGSGRRTLLVTHDATLGYVFGKSFDFRLLPPVSESAPSLSIVARAVGVADMIGTTPALAGKFGKGARLTVDLSDQRCDGQTCDPTNQVCCQTSADTHGCVDVQGDVANCGGCGTDCGSSGDSCSGAACRCSGGSSCATGTTCCAGTGCIDLQTDPFHCGACDKACNPGETCVGGACKCGTSPGCAASTLCCADSGTCAAPGAGCPCGAVTCNFPQICCSMASGTCADTKSDNSNCGTCGHACTAPLACANGACACNGTVCAASDTCCGSGCANTGNDPNNCGACGHHCRAGEVCSGGQCLCGTTACTPMQLCCNSMCVSPSGANCGACNHSCKIGEVCNGNTCTCNGGNNCTGSQICCPPAGTAGGGGCFDPSSDPNHCGDCNTRCTPGDACVMGHCQATPCNPPCMNGNSCVGGQCRCEGSGGCGNGETCCPGEGCKNLATDPKNCNSCGKACGKGDYCCSGTCTPPDSNNCGGCGDKCSGGCCTNCSPPVCGALCLCL